MDEVFREIVFPNAYMRDFTETINPNTGEGSFVITLLQKIDKVGDIVFQPFDEEFREQRIEDSVNAVSFTSYISEPDTEPTASGPENAPPNNIKTYSEECIDILNEKNGVKKLNFTDKKNLADWWIDEYIPQKNNEDSGKHNYKWLNELPEKYLNNLIDLYSSFAPEKLINECYDTFHAGNAQSHIDDDDENSNCYVYALNGCLGSNGRTGPEGIPGRTVKLYIDSSKVKLYAIGVLADLYYLRRRTEPSKKIQGRIIEIKNFKDGAKSELLIGKNEYRIALRCDNDTSANGYHFMKENIDGTWSEKHNVNSAIKHPYGIRPEESYKYKKLTPKSGITEVWLDNAFDSKEIVYLAITRV